MKTETQQNLVTADVQVTGLKKKLGYDIYGSKAVFFKI